MKIFILNNLEHFLFVLLFISRLGDIGSTYLATPAVKLETDPVARKYRWLYATMTMSFCSLAYLNTDLVMILLVPSLLVSYSNFSQIWAIRVLGETGYNNFILALCRKGEVSNAIA